MELSLLGSIASAIISSIITLVIYNKTIARTEQEKVRCLELKLVQLMDRKEVMEHVEKQINQMNLLMESRLKPIQEDVKEIKEMTKIICKRE